MFESVLHFMFPAQFVLFQTFLCLLFVPGFLFSSAILDFSFRTISLSSKIPFCFCLTLCVLCLGLYTPTENVLSKEMLRQHFLLSVKFSLNMSRNKTE